MVNLFKLAARNLMRYRRRTLRLGDNMWLYIPNVGKPLRITSLQSVIGGVFNFSLNAMGRVDDLRR